MAYNAVEMDCLFKNDSENVNNVSSAFQNKQFSNKYPLNETTAVKGFCIRKCSEERKTKIAIQQNLRFFKFHLSSVNHPL